MSLQFHSPALGVSCNCGAFQATWKGYQQMSESQRRDFLGCIKSCQTCKQARLKGAPNGREQP